jgi:hypothetical protein
MLKHLNRLYSLLLAWGQDWEMRPRAVNISTTEFPEAVRVPGGGEACRNVSELRAALAVLAGQ